jgi:ankyrin repeat protein
MKLNKKSKTGETPLHRAAAQGRADYVRDLIERGATVNVQCFAGWTPLHKAALKGFVDIIEILCEHGANLDAQSTIEQDTPLHDACANGNMDVVRLLLQHGANPRIQNSAGFFPHEVVEDEFEELKAFMLNATNEFKESTTAQDVREDSEPPMSPATKRISRRTSTASDAPLLVQTHQNGRSRRGGGSSGRADDLLALDINYRDKQKRGNLTLGIIQANTDLVLKLLVMGAKVTAKDAEGNTPLHYAARGGHVDIAAALLEYGADVDALNKKNETPMHEVVGRDHKAMVELLLVMGADPTLKDSKGQTALDLLIEKKKMKGAEDEFPLLLAQFEQRGVELPPMPETEHAPIKRIKTEDVDEVTDLIKAVEYDPAKAVETNGSTEIEVADIRPSPNPRESTPPEKSDAPVDNAEVEVAIPEEIESPKEVDVSTPVPADEPPATPMEEVIHQELPPAPAPVESMITPPSSEPPPSMPENLNVMPEVHDSPEVSAIPSLPSPPQAKEPSPIPPVSDPTEEPMSVDVPEVEPEPVERAVSEPMVLDGVIEEKAPAEPEIDVPSPKAPSPPPPEPQWKKLSSLESLDASLQKEFCQILPIYTMNLKNDTNVVSYVAHPQICSLLGFTSNQFFEKCNSLHDEG